MPQGSIVLIQTSACFLSSSSVSVTVRVVFLLVSSRESSRIRFLPSKVVVAFRDVQILNPSTRGKLMSINELSGENIFANDFIKLQIRYRKFNTENLLESFTR